MAKLILASVLCIFFLVKGTEAAEAVTGASCASDTCEATEYCENDVCRLKIGKTCAKSAECVTGSECSTEGTTKGKCTCSGGATPSEDKTKCGAMGIAASMLLVVATFVTSRFV